MHLLFPQWQGSGFTDELYRGALLLKERMQDLVSFTEIDLEWSSRLEIESGIMGCSQIAAQLQTACGKLIEANPDRIFSIGGDCGIEIAPASFLNKKYAGDLGLIWLDAHGDLNTPESSLSGHFHGMALRLLLGEGAAPILGTAFSRFHSNQIFLIGCRDLDPPEQLFVNREKITLFSVEEIQQRPTAITDSIRDRGFEKIYIHLDLDVLDPQQFPFVKCPTPEGVSFEALLRLVNELKANFEILGFSIVEFCPIRNEGVGKLEELIEVYLSCYRIGPGKTGFENDSAPNSPLV
jgi:arginase